MRPPGQPPGLPKNGVGDREHGQRFKLHADLELPLPPNVLLSGAPNVTYP